MVLEGLGLGLGLGRGGVVVFSDRGLYKDWGERGT